MQITYRDFDSDRLADRALLAKWNNDPQTKHLINRLRDSADAERAFTPDDFRRLDGRALFMLTDGAPVGWGRFALDAPQLLRRDNETAWLALMIGDGRFRGQGLGRRLASHLESLAAGAGATRIEVGIFEHNAGSLRLFAGLGYREFARLPERAWWDGRMWGEVRLEKAI